MSASTQCSKCQTGSLNWGVSRGRVPVDVFLCSKCGHREKIEDWTAPVFPLTPQSCCNCGSQRNDDLCGSCGLSEDEDQQVHQELQNLITEDGDFLSAARDANRMGRRVLALKLATAAALFGKTQRTEAARALRVWLLSAIGEPKAAYKDALSWVSETEQPSQLAWGSLGQQCENVKFFAEASDAYGKALEVDPSQQMIRCRRAKLLLEQNREGQALAELTTVCESPLKGKTLQAAFIVGAMVLDKLEARGNHDESARLLGLFGSHVKESPNLLAHAARINALAGKTKEAHKQLKMARKLNPDLPIYARVEKVLGPQNSWRKW